MLRAMLFVHLVVSGRVQGVGFRYFVRLRALEHGVRGVVRNLAGGEVEIHAEGSRAALEALVADVSTGPTSARVEHVSESWGETTSGYKDFSISR